LCLPLQSNIISASISFSGSFIVFSIALKCSDSSTAFDNLFGNYGSDDDSLHKAIKIIEKENRGVIILIRDTGKSIINNLITNQSNPGNQIQTTSDELRIYGMGAQILSEIGVKKMILLTNTEWKFIGLDAFDIEIIETKFLNTIND